MSGPCTDCGGPDYQTLEAAIAELEAELAEANATIDAMDSWAGMMEQARKHYPQDVAYFAQSNDPGCRIVRGLHAIDVERQRAEKAEAAFRGKCEQCGRLQNRIGDYIKEKLALEAEVRQLNGQLDRIDPSRFVDRGES